MYMVGTIPITQGDETLSVTNTFVPSLSLWNLLLLLSLIPVMPKEMAK